MKDFFKTHAVICIISAVVLLLAVIWSPIIIKIAKKTSKEDNEISSVVSESSEEEFAVKNIICWGDSLTRGMGMQKSETYPDVLQRLVGYDYLVFNAGSSGEKSDTIAARQGALDVFVEKDIVFKAGVSTVSIGNKMNNGFMLADGTPIRLNSQCEAFTCDLSAKEVYINDVKYTLSITNALEFLLSRDDISADFTIKKGEKVVFASAKMQEKSYCEIFYVGANDGLKTTYEWQQFIVKRYQEMIARHGNKRYLVVIPQWTDYFDDALISAFGDRAVNLRSKDDIIRIMKEMDLEPTDADMKLINAGQLPLSIRYRSSDSELHLNKYGYEYMATLLYERGVDLGYWD